MNLELVRKTFTDWAPFYDATHAWSMPYRQTARLALGIRTGDRVLDLACGTGLNFAHLRQLVGQTGSILGVDLTPAMLDVARHRISRAGWKNVTVREADAAHLPFPDASFDKVICTYALSIIPDDAEAVAEMKRMLIPGGRLASLEVQIAHPWLSRLLHRLGPLCNVDTSRNLLGTLRLVFPQLQIRTYGFGMIFLALGTKA